MPGPLHQTLVALFAAVPTLLEEVLRASERTSSLLPSSDVAVEAVPETTVVEPVELRADAVFVAEAAGRRLVVVLEVQLRRDPTKRQAWVNYAAAASRQFRADNVVVVVVTANEGVARWARRQTVPLTDAVFAPLVVGPQELTRLNPDSTSTALAVPALELATRPVRPPAAAIADYLQRLHGLDHATGRAYADLVLARLNRAQQDEVEAIMTARTRTGNILDDATERGIHLGRQEGRQEGDRLRAERARAEILATASSLLPPDVIAELAAIEDHATLVARAFAAVAERGRRDH